MRTALRLVAVVVGLIALTVALQAAASYPSATKSFSTKLSGAVIASSHINDLQDEIVAVENGLLSGLAHTVKPLTDAAYDLGAGAFQWRDLYLSRNAAIGGTLAVTSTSTLTGAATFSSADNSFKVGASTETHKGAGVIDTDSTQAATAANTTETILRTYTLPANALNANGRVMRVWAWGSFAANGNTKTIRARFGGIGGTIVVVHASASNNIKWVICATIVRTGASTQDWFSFLPASGAAQDINATFGTATQTDTAAIDLVVTGQNNTASASDIVYEGSLVEFLN